MEVKRPRPSCVVERNETSPLVGMCMTVQLCSATPTRFPVVVAMPTPMADPRKPPVGMPIDMNIIVVFVFWVNERNHFAAIGLGFAWIQ